eukprot:TRINITY_DN8168_c0_g1_i1.p1 TRINITY_DN8168_c0_g1~~TRINITY_DN8168_c0_g1_i1.p1  ORF type:complete len:283 (+),score=138.85 TRINITY_DN8168_c0_g1_i1:46-849(+)
MATQQKKQAIEKGSIIQVHKNENTNLTEKQEIKEQENDSFALNKINRIVIPGEIIGRVEPGLSLVLGTGLYQNNDSIVASKAGMLRFKRPHKFWVECNALRYVPSVEDPVLGIIIDRNMDSYKVDIGCALMATLPVLAFEGATKKNRPNIQIGALVYARVVVANKDMEPELVCTSISGKADEFGEIKDGYAFKTSLSLAKNILLGRCPALKLLGTKFAFEIAVGINGRIWINSNSISTTLKVANILSNSEFLNIEQLAVMIDELVTN